MGCSCNKTRKTVTTQPKRKTTVKPVTRVVRKTNSNGAKGIRRVFERY